MLTSYNAEVAAELNRYGDVLVAEVTSVLERVAGSAQAPSTDAAMAIVAGVLQPELYVKRFALFAEGIAHRVQGYGIAFDLGEHRVDIPKGLAEVDAINRCARIRARVATSIDKLYLTALRLEGDVVAVRGAPQGQKGGLYDRANRYCREHPFMVTAIGLAASLLFFLLG